MRQKYIVSKKAETKEMTIQEFAVVDNDSYRKDKYLLTDADFVLLSEQSYPLDVFKKAISKDKEVIIESLRTGEFFPARLCAEKIADSIVELFNSENDQPIVLIYDDKDGFTEEAPEEEEAEPAKEEAKESETAK